MRGCFDSRMKIPTGNAAHSAYLGRDVVPEQKHSPGIFRRIGGFFAGLIRA
jgi:hypothetical protein